ncbi:MAG: PaaI family thioesterase [Hyphomicrobiales bacterium]|nr:PaaI family thioesterase [Hyphomicrobiales bacterium]
MNETASPIRQRIVRWEDPMIVAKMAREMAGIDLFRKLLAEEGAPPPIMKLIGQSLEEVEEGRVVMKVEPGEHLYNPIGVVHGGVMATLLDSVMGCAVHTMLPKGRAYTTLEIKVNYLRAIKLDTGSIFGEGKAVHVGRSSAVAEGKAYDSGGKLYATASTTCMVFAV